MQTTGIDFGVIHVGQTASIDVQIANIATNDLTDDLSSTPGTLGEFSAENGIDDVAAGDQSTITVSVTGELVGPSLILDSSPLFGLVSHDDDLPDQGVGLQNIPALSATVYEYADPVISNDALGTSVGILSQDGYNWALDLCAINPGLSGDDAFISIENAAESIAYSDTLTGTADFSASPDGGFIQAFTDLSGQIALGGGGLLSLGAFAAFGDTLGSHSETVIFHPLDSNGSGYSEFLPNETLTVVDDVVPDEIDGATIAASGDTVTVSVPSGVDAVIDPLFASVAIDDLIIDGPGTAEIDGTPSVADLTAGSTLLLGGSFITTDPFTIEAGGNMGGSGIVLGFGTIDGILNASGGTLDLTNDITGAGTLTPDPGAALLLAGTIAPSETIIFGAPNETLLIGPIAQISAPIQDLVAGDIIGLPAGQLTSAVFEASDNGLTITGSDGSSMQAELARRLPAERLHR